MEQRPLRLGDLVDDYCPRERRVTNHSVVAIVDDKVRQTRCATCDTEHEYKGARPKVLRKKAIANGTEAASEPVSGVLVSPATNGAEATDTAPTEAAANVAVEVEGEEVGAVVGSENGTDGDAEPGAEEAPAGWISHRPLIRAQLPKVEGGEPPPRPIPEFTMHQRPARSFHGRGFRHGGAGNPSNGSPSNHGGFFRDGNGPDGNRPGQPGKAGRRRRRRRH